MHSLVISFTCLSAIALAAAAPPEQFLTTLHFAIREDDSALLERAQNLLLDEFSQTLQRYRALSNRGYEVRTTGNEVVLTLISPEDLRDPMQSALPSMIRRLDGRVHMHGGARFYKTPFSQLSDGILDVLTEGRPDTPGMPDMPNTPNTNGRPKQIRAITAQAVPLSDLLKELKAQVGHFSYLIPGECGKRFVEWNFGNPGAAPKSVDIALEELSVLFGLKLAKQDDTYIFTGSCENPLPRTSPLLEPAFFPLNAAKARVYFPAFRLTD